jgi:hypothetical protein
MSHEPFRVEVEPEGLASRRVAELALAAIGITVACVVIVRFATGPRPRVATTVQGPAPREIGRIEQTLIDVDPVQSDLKREAARTLSGYGWVDREKGIVRIPLERAYELLIRSPR